MIGRMRHGYLVGACVMLLVAPFARANGPTREELEIQPSGPVRLPERRSSYTPAYVSEAARLGERRYNYARSDDYALPYYGYYSACDNWGYGFDPYPCFGPAVCPVPRYDYRYGPLGHHRFVGPVPLRLLNRLYR